MENFFQNTRQWVQGESTEAIIITIFGIATLIIGIIFLCQPKVPGAKAIAYPLLVCGVLYVGIGAYNYQANLHRTEEYQQAYDHDSLTFIKSEKQRVESFQYMYKISKAVATVFFLGTILIFWLTPSPVWQGIGIGLTLFGLAGLIVDYFSQLRADHYYDLILSALASS